MGLTLSTTCPTHTPEEPRVTDRPFCVWICSRYYHTLTLLSPSLYDKRVGTNVLVSWWSTGSVLPGTVGLLSCTPVPVPSLIPGPDSSQTSLPGRSVRRDQESGTGYEVGGRRYSSELYRPYFRDRNWILESQTLVLVPSRTLSLVSRRTLVPVPRDTGTTSES